MHTLLKHKDVKDLARIWLVDANGRVHADAAADCVKPVHDGLTEPRVNATADDNISRGVQFVKALTTEQMWLPSTYSKYAATESIVG